MSDGSQSLHDWRIHGKPLDLSSRIYDTRIWIRRNEEEWELCGCLNLAPEEYQLLSRVFLAHEASYGQPR